MTTSDSRIKSWEELCKSALPVTTSTEFSVTSGGVDCAVVEGRDDRIHCVGGMRLLSHVYSLPYNDGLFQKGEKVIIARSHKIIFWEEYWNYRYDKSGDIPGVFSASSFGLCPGIVSDKILIPFQAIDALRGDVEVRHDPRDRMCYYPGEEAQ